MQLKFSIRNSTHYLGFLRRLVAAAGRMVRGLNPDHAAVASCSLALVEAVNNVIFHAHGKDSDQWIDIVINVRNNAIEMDVCDNGPGFDMPELAMPPVDHTHGRGLFIIKSVMHEVAYRRGSRNVLKMVYHL